MSVSYAILLDGGFVRRKLGTAKQPVDAAGISAFTTKVGALPCRCRRHPRPPVSTSPAHYPARGLFLKPRQVPISVGQ